MFVILEALLAAPALGQVVMLSGEVYDGQKGPIGRGVHWCTGTIRVPAGKTLTIPNQSLYLGIPIAFQAVGVPNNRPGFGNFTNVVRPRIVQ